MCSGIWRHPLKTGKARGIKGAEKVQSGKKCFMLTEKLTNSRFVNSNASNDSGEDEETLKQ